MREGRRREWSKGGEWIKMCSKRTLTKTYVFAL